MRKVLTRNKQVKKQIKKQEKDSKRWESTYRQLQQKKEEWIALSSHSFPDKDCNTKPIKWLVKAWGVCKVKEDHPVLYLFSKMQLERTVHRKRMDNVFQWRVRILREKDRGTGLAPVRPKKILYLFSTLFFFFFFFFFFFLVFSFPF